MNAADIDTETMLVMLSSLLHPQEFEDTVLLDALVLSNGDIDAAARSLQSEPPKKRRRLASTASIEGWLKERETSSLVPPRLGGENSSSLAPRVNSPTSVTKENTDSQVVKTSSQQKEIKRRAQGATKDAFTALLQPSAIATSSSKQQGPRMLPLMLSTPALVAEHTPCTMHYSVLPPELACRLYYTLLYASRDWERASSHRTSFYRRSADNKGPADNDNKDMEYWYQGRRRELPPAFPPVIEEACKIIEQVVNAEMRKRERYPLEWGACASTKEGEEPLLWRANVAASNCYAGAKENICYHSDQLTHLGPYPTIASLSLGVSRAFRLREVVPTDEKDQRAARTLNIPLRHNSLVIMHPPTQEMFKHCVPPQNSIDMFHPPFPPPPCLTEDKSELARLQAASNSRINVTFRFFRPDFHSRTIPRCNCGIPCILRPDMRNRYSEASPSALVRSGIDVQAGSSKSSSIISPGASAPEIRHGRNAVARYWWACAVGGRKDGKGCNYWKVMDMNAEGRGPFAGDTR
ncbi:hypothetical protein BV20DRAFT_1126265 [Pilatotrama ljubarskyi]|nr:hypothetical protein BV20DRAFT_1126265 [Pilatotrama ljubarskyi]